MEYTIAYSNIPYEPSEEQMGLFIRTFNTTPLRFKDQKASTEAKRFVMNRGGFERWLSKKYYDAFNADAQRMLIINKWRQATLEDFLMYKFDENVHNLIIQLTQITSNGTAGKNSVNVPDGIDERISQADTAGQVDVRDGGTGE